MKARMLGRLQVNLQNDVGCYFIKLLLALLGRQCGFSKQTRGQGRGITFVDESHGALGRLHQPPCEGSGLLSLNAVAAVAMDRQTDHPTGDLIFDDEFSKMVGFERSVCSLKGFQRANPRSTRIAQGDSDANCAEVDSGQSACFRPRKILFARVSQFPQPS